MAALGLFFLQNDGLTKKKTDNTKLVMLGRKVLKGSYDRFAWVKDFGP